eukprot:g11912.t1
MHAHSAPTSGHEPDEKDDPASPRQPLKIAVIGAGVSGLIAAYELASFFELFQHSSITGEKDGRWKNRKVVLHLIDKASQVGGRVQTEAFEGYLLDHGFQVLLTAYPEVQKYLKGSLLARPKRVKCFAQGGGAVLSYDEDLPGAQHVAGGAGVTQPHNKKLWVVANPLTYPRGICGTLKTMVWKWGPLQTAIDVWRLAVRLILPEWVMRGVYDTRPWSPQQWAVSTPSIRGLVLNSNSYRYSLLGLALATTDLYLTGHLQLSRTFTNGFLRPFFEAIYVSPLRQQKAALFNFVLKMLALGGAGLPENGMRQIPEQLLEDIYAVCKKAKALEFSLMLNTETTRLFNLSPASTPLSHNLSTASATRGGGGGDNYKQNAAPAASASGGRVGVEFRNGVSDSYDFVVLAADWPGAQKLLQDEDDRTGRNNEDERRKQPPEPRHTQSATYYFSLPEAELPVTEPLIVLHSYAAEEPIHEYEIRHEVESLQLQRPLLAPRPFRVTNVGFPSVVQRSYAPPGRHLMAATLMLTTTRDGDDDKAAEFPPESWVLEQVCTMLGIGVVSAALKGWKFLKRFVIPFHQPHHGCGVFEPEQLLIGGSIVCCGDYTCDPTLDGAMRSGRRAAEYVKEQLAMKKMSEDVL